jgi:hypothetical protein
VVGAVILIFAMAVIAPIGLFLVGAIWSALLGWFLSDDADTRAEAQTSS